MRLLVTGAAGFVGGAVCRAAEGHDLCLLLHRRDAPGHAGPRAQVVRGDLGDARTLRGACAGVDAVLHLASYIGPDADRCEEVNHQGTRRLLAEAADAGVERFVHLSTAAVYGGHGHRGLREDEVAPAPVSPTSRSRYRAERAVIGAGGVALRPFLVYGPGDAWVAPTVAELVRLVPAVVDGGAARLSMIAVDDLARAAVALATATGFPAGTTYHACHPRPVTSGRLLAAVADAWRLPRPSADLGLDDYLRRLPADGPSARQALLVLLDHWYDGTALWRDTGLSPGPGFDARFAEYRRWREQDI